MSDPLRTGWSALRPEAISALDAKDFERLCYAMVRYEAYERHDGPDVEGPAADYVADQGRDIPLTVSSPPAEAKLAFQRRFHTKPLTDVARDRKGRNSRDRRLPLRPFRRPFPAALRRLFPAAFWRSFPAAYLPKLPLFLAPLLSSLASPQPCARRSCPSLPFASFSVPSAAPSSLSVSAVIAVASPARSLALRLVVARRSAMLAAATNRPRVAAAPMRSANTATASVIKK